MRSEGPRFYDKMYDMILECDGCRHSYDVSSYESGQRLRCHCGQILVVPKKKPVVHTALTIHCANCGGHLKKGQPDCQYCGAMVDLTHARLTAYCSSCFCMSKSDAKFCSGCGKPLVAKVGKPKEAQERCPRCGIPMRNRDVGAHVSLECPMCCGLFVEVDVLGSMIEKQKETAMKSAGAPGASPKQATLTSEPVTYIKCPVCDGMMNRMNYGRISGVIVDYCREHGYWLDGGELEKIAEWVATGGLEKQKQRERDEMKSEKARLARSTAESVRLTGEGYMGEPGRSRLDFKGGLLGLVAKLFD